MKRIGIYGGTFNPPHVGHIRAALYGLEALGLERLLIMPSNLSPHKQLPAGSPTPQQRLQMLRLCFEDPRVEVSELELARGGTSYTYETLQQLRQQYPDHERIFFMGTDMFLSLLNWREPQIIMDCASLAVFYRGQRREKELIEGQKTKLEALGARVYLVENPVTEISSTDLRRMMTFGCGDVFLPTPVAAFIRRERLYDSGECKGLSEAQLEQRVISLLKPSRVNHVLGCRDAAVKLAHRWGADPVAAARAGLLHDVTKALDGPLQLTLCEAYGIILDNFSTQNTKILHALTGSLVAERIFGESPEVVSAICSHTTAKPNMNTLEKIIYVADYMEPNRDFPGVEKLRQLADTDLDGALKLGLEMTMEVLRQEGKQICPQSQQALDYLNKKLP